VSRNCTSHRVRSGDRIPPERRSGPSRPEIARGEPPPDDMLRQVCARTSPIGRTLHESSRRIYGRAHPFVHPPLRSRADGRQRDARCWFSSRRRGGRRRATGWTKRGGPGHAEHGSGLAFSGHVAVRVCIGLAGRNQFNCDGFSCRSGISRPDTGGSAIDSPGASRCADGAPNTRRSPISIGLLIARNWLAVCAHQ